MGLFKFSLGFFCAEIAFSAGLPVNGRPRVWSGIPAKSWRPYTVICILGMAGIAL